MAKFPYTFDPQMNNAPSGVLEMLQRAMQAQSLQQQRAGYMPQPSASPGDNTGTPPGGLLGRMLALQAGEHRPLDGVREQAPSAPFDPNFRQLSRAYPAVQRQVGGGAFNRPDDSSSSYFPFGDAAPPDVLRTSDQSSGEYSTNNERPAPVIAGFGRIGKLAPFPLGPGPTPQTSSPGVAEAWRVAQDLLRLYGMMRYGRMGGGRKNEDEYRGEGYSEGSGSTPNSPGGQPPNNNRGPQGGILGPLLLQDGRQRQSPSGENDEMPSEQLDPNFRQTYPDWLAQAKKAKKSQSTRSGVNSSLGNKGSSRIKSSSGNNGGGNNDGGGRRGGDNDDFCTKRMYEEQDECKQRQEDGEIDTRDFRACMNRAVRRWDACNQKLSWEPPKWQLDPDEEVWINNGR